MLSCVHLDAPFRRSIQTHRTILTVLVLVLTFFNIDFFQQGGAGRQTRGAEFGNQPERDQPRVVLPTLATGLGDESESRDQSIFAQSLVRRGQPHVGRKQRLEATTTRVGPR